MGGGTILVLFLSNFLHVEQHVAQATNLLYFIPTSLAAIWVYGKNKNIDKKVALHLIPFGIVFAILGSYLAMKIEAKNLKKFFGIFLLIVAVYEIIITVKNKCSQKGWNLKNILTNFWAK